MRRKLLLALTLLVLSLGLQACDNSSFTPTPLPPKPAATNTPLAAGPTPTSPPPFPTEVPTAIGVPPTIAPLLPTPQTTIDTPAPTGVPGAVITPTAPAAITIATQFAYVAPDGSLHLRDAAGKDVQIAAAGTYSTPLQVDEYQSAYANYAAFSPDGKYIAYLPQAGGNVTVVDVDQSISGGQAAAVYTGKAKSEANTDYLLAWSPNSRYLAYTYKFTGAAPGVGNDPYSPTSLLITEVATGKEGTGVRDVNGPFVWSPDSRCLAITQSRAIMVIAGPHTVTDCLYGGLDTFTTSTAPGFRMGNWSPDGHYLTFSGGEANAAVPALGLQSTQAPESSVLIAKQSDLPQWSPDGKLLFYRQLDKQGVSIYTYNVFAKPVAGGATQRLDNLDSYSSYLPAPFILPNGDYIFNNMELAPDGKPVKELWSYKGAVFGWSPNHQTVATRHDVYVGSSNYDPHKDTRSLELITLPDTQATRIYTSTGAVDNGPSIKMTALWSPEGSYLSFYAMGGSDSDLKPLDQSVIGVVAADDSVISHAEFGYAMPVGWLGKDTALFQDLNVDNHAATQAIYTMQAGGKANKLVEGVFLATHP